MKTVFKKGPNLMYQFLNTPASVSSLVWDCNLPVSPDGSAQIFGEDYSFPDVIHFYPSRNPRVTDPYRLFILEKTAFKYKEIL